MRNRPPDLPDEKKCRKCNQVRPMPSLRTVVLTYVCSPSGRNANKMSCDAPRGHCSRYLLLDNIMNVLQVKDVSHFKAHKGQRDGLHSYCHGCYKAINDAYDRGRLAPPESAVHPLKRCGACGEVSCHRLCVVCHCRHCVHSRYCIVCSNRSCHAPEVLSRAAAAGIAFACRSSPRRSSLQTAEHQMDDTTIASSVVQKLGNDEAS